MARTYTAPPERTHPLRTRLAPLLFAALLILGTATAPALADPGPGSDSGPGHHGSSGPG
jgi:hypothetical protein